MAEHVQGDQGTLQQTFVDCNFKVPPLHSISNANSARFPSAQGKSGRQRNIPNKVNKQLLQSALVTLYIFLPNFRDHEVDSMLELLNGLSVYIPERIYTLWKPAVCFTLGVWHAGNSSEVSHHLPHKLRKPFFSYLDVWTFR